MLVSVDPSVRMDSTSTVSPPGEEVARSGPERPDVSDDPDTTDAARGGSLPKDDLFHLLQNSRRRAVLRYLRGREGPVRMRDVAEQVAAWEHDTTVAALRSDERQRVYVALYQSHLDTLADAGVIEYDKSRGVLEPRPLLDHVAAYTNPPEPVDSIEPTGPTGPTGPTDPNSSADTGRRLDEGASGRRGEVGSNGHRDGDEGDLGGTWDRWYLGVSAAGSVLLVVTVLDVAAFGAVPGVAVAALVLLAFSALTVAKLALDGRDRGRAQHDG